MADMNEVYRFQVSIWIEGNGRSDSLFERGAWMEQARCLTKSRATEVATCLSLRHGAVQAAELVSDVQGARFVGYLFLPASASELRSGE